MTRGIYALIIENCKASRLQIGKLGMFLFPAGIYVYLGSALGKTSTNLEHRLKRHCSSIKKLFWHIDYLLNAYQTKILSILCASTSDRKECELVKTIRELKDFTVPIYGFGSSDCTEKCGAHLIYYEGSQSALMQSIRSAFSKIGLRSIEVKNGVL
jgi:Uri superfamily endonuclease